jgi:hypothetical protein
VSKIIIQYPLFRACSDMVGKRIVIFSLMLFSNLAVAGDNCGSLERIDIAVRLVRTLYPELRAAELSIALGDSSDGGRLGPTDARAFVMKIDNPRWHPPKQGKQGEPIVDTTHTSKGQLRGEFPLILTFDFIDYGRHRLECRPSQFMLNRPNKMQEEAQAEINAHPSWTEAEALEAAKRHGLRFGPNNKQAVRKLIPLKELSTFFGTLRIKRTQFTITSEHEKDAQYSFASLSWYIIAEEVDTTRALQIVVEPFGGHIVGLSEGNQRDLLQ